MWLEACDSIGLHIFGPWKNMNNPLLEESGLPRFSAIRPEHVEPALAATLERNRTELEALLNNSAEADFAGTIAPLEEMMDRLHRAWAPVNHLHMVANSDALRDAYNRCLPVLSDYTTELAQDERLFQLYNKVSEGLGKKKSVEAKLLEVSLRDFQLAGIDLPLDKKARYKEAVSELAQLQALFEQNLLDEMAAWSHHTTSAAEVEGVPVAVLAQAKRQAEADDLDGWLLRLDQPTYVAVLTHADNPALREKFYRAWVTRCSDQSDSEGQFDNTSNMDDILTLRHEIAGLVGFENFADYALATRMAKSVEEVESFLLELAAVSLPVATKEFAALQEWAGTTLSAWDVGYYSEKLRRDKFSISDAELRPYFPLDSVLDGLFKVIKNLYGIDVVQAHDIDTWDDKVRYYRLVNPDGTEVGGFFMDLFARSNKRSGAWMDECLLRTRVNGQLENPVAHLVCNYTEPSQGKPALLSHDEIVTLFHECGHTLHHLLSIIDYPSIAGTRVAWDAVELPSQFMENFAWDKEVLRDLSSHIETGESLPDDMLSRINASRVFQAGMAMIRQLEFSLFDWRMHANYDPSEVGQILATHERVRDEVSVIKAPAYSRLPNSFAHVFSGSYAAGYYSYKWAEVLAADAFMAFREAGLFDANLARQFREQILEIGGSRDFAKAYEAFRGRPASVEPLLIQDGILENTETTRAVS
jgi:oligopeptidase A